MYKITLSKPWAPLEDWYVAVCTEWAVCSGTLLIFDRRSEECPLKMGWVGVDGDIKDQRMRPVLLPGAVVTVQTLKQEADSESCAA